MSELVFEEVSMEINKTKIVNSLTFYAKGLCCVFFNLKPGEPKKLPFLFSKTHLYSSNMVNISGSVYFDGKALPAAKFCHLLNHHFVCEGNDSVLDILFLINKEEAERTVRRLGIRFYNKRVCHLNVQESRLFEIAINLIAKPPVMYLRTLGLTRRQQDRCLSMLSRFVEQHESVIFIETEFSDMFDCAIIVTGSEVLSLSKQESSRFFKRKDLSTFSLSSSSNRGKCAKSNIADEFVSEVHLNKTGEAYDYRKLFERYKTGNVVDLKHVSMPTWDRLTTFDFYKVSLAQAIALGYKRYEITFQKHEKRVVVLKSLFPSFILIFILRLVDELTDKANIQYTPGLIALACDACFNENTLPALVAFFLQAFILKDFSASKVKLLLKKFFRAKFSEIGHRLIFTSACFSVLYQYSSIFEENFQALSYNINILMTPGTYIVSIFVFAALAHFSTFCFLGWVFNVRFMFLTSVCAFFINLACFSFLGKRLRTTFIGFFTSTCLFSALTTATKSHSSLTLYMLYIAFPLLIHSQGSTGECYPTVSILSLIYVILYCIVIYIVVCYRISFC